MHIRLGKNIFFRFNNDSCRCSIMTPAGKKRLCHFHGQYEFFCETKAQVLLGYLLVIRSDKVPLSNRKCKIELVWWYVQKQIPKNFKGASIKTTIVGSGVWMRGAVATRGLSHINTAVLQYSIYYAAFEWRLTFTKCVVL